ncbi:MAG: THUMP domain-containing protein [Lentisphaeria bacterium]
MAYFFANAARGTERLLLEELRELGFQELELAGGGVAFTGEWSEGWRACLWSRIAHRVMLEMVRFPGARTPEDLYAGVRALDWRPFLTIDHSFSVTALPPREGPLRNPNFTGLKVKDAIVDACRDQLGDRPMVNRDQPDLRVVAHISPNGDASIYADLVGEPLCRRGYRSETGEAPLRESLAAALLRFSGWDRRTPLLDPCGGSGTIAIEAALWAANIAPGLFRQQFSCERWPLHDARRAAELRELRGRARAERRSDLPPITVGDLDPAMLEVARANARRAGVRLAFRQGDVRELRGWAPPLAIVTNPPYGVRMTADTAFFRQFGAAMARLHGARVTVLAGTPELARELPARILAAQPVHNGALDAEMLTCLMP